MSIFSEAEKTINGERQDTYGNPEYSFEFIAAYWTAYIDHEDVTLSAIDVAHMMALFKIARMSGQKFDRDNYRDAIGYLGIAADRLAGMKPTGNWVEPTEPEAKGLYDSKGDKRTEELFDAMSGVVSDEEWDKEIENEYLKKEPLPTKKAANVAEWRKP
jgi:hypothetical protein